METYRTSISILMAAGAVLALAVGGCDHNGEQPEPPPPAEQLSISPVAPKTVEEGKEVAFELVASDSAAKVSFLDNLPGGAKLQGRRFAWTPDFNQAQAAPYRLTFTARSGQREASQVVEITVQDVNRKPRVRNLHPAGRRYRATVGEQAAFRVDAWDPDGDTLSYTWMRAGKRTDESGPAFSCAFLRVGTQTVEVKVSDGKQTVPHKWRVDVKTWEQVAQEQIDARQYDATRALLRRILADFDKPPPDGYWTPNQVDTLVAAKRLLGDCLFEEGRFSDARSAYEEAVKFHMQNPYLQLRIGVTYLREGESAKGRGAKSTYFDRAREVLREIPDNFGLDPVIRLEARYYLIQTEYRTAMIAHDTADRKRGFQSALEQCGYFEEQAPEVQGALRQKLVEQEQAIRKSIENQLDALEL